MRVDRLEGVIRGRRRRTTVTEPSAPRPRDLAHGAESIAVVASVALSDSGRIDVAVARAVTVWARRSPPSSRAVSALSTTMATMATTHRVAGSRRADRA